MNYELKIKLRKILKDEYIKGNITEREYNSQLEKLRTKKKKETLLTKIKNILK
jgi:hypothetical protein